MSKKISDAIARMGDAVKYPEDQWKGDIREFIRNVKSPGKSE